MVGGVSDRCAQQPVCVIPRSKITVVVGQRLHQLVREPKVHETADAVANDQRRAGERVGVGRVLPETDLDAAEYVDGVGMFAIELIEHRPSVDHDAVATLCLVDEHRQHLAAGRVRVLGVVVVRRDLLGRERDVVALGIQLDVEDQAERGIAHRQADRAEELQDRARLGRRSGDHRRAVASNGFEHAASCDLIGDALLMVEAFDRRSRSSRAWPSTRRGCRSCGSSAIRAARTSSDGRLPNRRAVGCRRRRPLSPWARSAVSTAASGARRSARCGTRGTGSCRATSRAGPSPTPR